MHDAPLPSWLHPRLAEVLGAMDDVEWAELQSAAAVIDLAAGERLFDAGEPADHWYVVLSGRLAVLGPALSGAPPVRLGDAGAGELLGELGVLTGEPRSASVHAVRDSRLLRLSAPLMHGPLLRSPERATTLLRQLARRMADRSGAAPTRMVGLCITLLPAGPGLDLRAFAQGLASALCAWGSCVVCGLDDGPAAGLPPASQGEAARQAWMRVDAALDARALAADHVVLLADPQDSDWTRHALQRADHVLVVADADAPPEPRPHEAGWLAQRLRQSAPADATLVLLQPVGRRMPRGTAAWLDARPGLPHRHLSADARADGWARLARHVTGRGWALALSGGGARCFAQLGVVQAMVELGIPIDGVSGTSGGAMSGALIAQGLAPEALRAAARRFHESRPFRRGTLPLYSLRSGAPLEAALRDGAGDLLIEDLWLPLVVVSANLTRAQPHWHRRGSVVDAVRASSSLPGLLPPWLHDGELLVDGGLVDNLPVDVARQCVAPRVLAVDVTEDTAPRFEAERYPSPWPDLSALWPDRQRQRPPGLLAILMHSLLLGSLAQTRRQREAADLCLRPPLPGVGMMATHRWAEIIAAGHRDALAGLAALAPETR